MLTFSWCPSHLPPQCASWPPASGSLCCCPASPSGHRVWGGRGGISNIFISASLWQHQPHHHHNISNIVTSSTTSPSWYQQHRDIINHITIMISAPLWHHQPHHHHDISTIVTSSTTSPSWYQHHRDIINHSMQSLGIGEDKCDGSHSRWGAGKMYSYISDIQTAILSRRGVGLLPPKIVMRLDDPRRLGLLASVQPPPTSELVQVQVSWGTLGTLIQRNLKKMHLHFFNIPN